MMNAAHSSIAGCMIPRQSSFVGLRFGLIAILAMLVGATSIYAQSLSVFDVDASSFPTIKAKFYAFDAAGNRISGLFPGDVQVTEDGTPRTVTHVSCPPVSSPEALSSVLTIDISGSMSGSGIQSAQAAARAWVAALPLGESECAITTFNSRSYLNQDFTTVRTSLLAAITALGTGGSTNFDAALLTPPAGALDVSKRGKNKKVVIFLTDGRAGTSNQSAIVAEAQRQNVTIYGVILKLTAPQVVKNLCSQTGGLWFENITTEQEAEEAYRRILQTAQGGPPCELQWTSDGCDTYRSLEVTLPGLAVGVRTSYLVPLTALPQLLYTTSRSLHFGEVTPGTQMQQQVTMTAQGRPIRIDWLTTSHTGFRFIDYGGNAPPFTLASGQNRTLTVEYAPEDSSYAFCLFEVKSDACLTTWFYADGGWTGKHFQKVVIKVIRANGGEQFVAGTEEELTWEGVMPEEKVRLEYSTDGGSTWMLITDAATGLRYSWRVPKTPGNQCLLRATAKANPMFTGDMVLIPAGTFRMGNLTDHSWGDWTEKPVHKVTLTRPFLMSRTEVTQEQYEAVMGNNPSYFTRNDYPVEQVDWYEAITFCNELSKFEGLDTCYSGGYDVWGQDSTVCDLTANGYRLPTEAEWEYACRGGTETDYYTGNMTNGWCSPLDSALDRGGWYCANAGSPRVVGLKEPNRYGLYDMHGNVDEWCWDWRQVYPEEHVVDPRGWGSGWGRVTRGGGGSSNARYCRSSYRGWVNPNSRNNNIGFRIVRTY